MHKAKSRVNISELVGLLPILGGEGQQPNPNEVRLARA